MDISSGSMHQLVFVLMSEVLAFGAIVYTALYLVKRRSVAQQAAFCTGPSAANETFIKRETKLDINRRPAEVQVQEHPESALV